MPDSNRPSPFSEMEFRRSLLSGLRSAGIGARVEAGVRRDWDVPYLLRCDIAIPSPDAMSWGTIIECKVNADPQTLSLALGQAVLYRRAFLADSAIICFPEAVRLPGMFAETCAGCGILLANEGDLVAVVRSLRQDKESIPPAAQGRDVATIVQVARPVCFGASHLTRPDHRGNDDNQVGNA